MSNQLTKLVKLRDETYNRLVKHGTMKETFDSVITKILDHYEGKDKDKEKSKK